MTERTDILVRPQGDRWQVGFGDRRWPAVIGRGGVTDDKQEGDGATPLGCWPLRRLLYRADRAAAPHCVLPAQPIGPSDGWCDDPDDPSYNQPVRLPYAASHEELCRDDSLYDLLVVLGYNDEPVVAGRGSAIFLHIARPGGTPTEGCVALARADLEELLGLITLDSRLCVSRG